MSDLLLEKIYFIQKEYLKILKRAENDIFNNERVTRAILDEMYVFWNNNRQVIELFLNCCCSNKDTYFYTAAVSLDLHNNAHYPFLTFGKQHIWDDPVYSYRVGLQLNNQDLNDMFVKQLLQTIHNDIEILEKLNKYIIVLPLRMLCEARIEEYQPMVEKLFIPMLVKEIKLTDFLKINDIYEVENLFKPNASEFIVFEYGEVDGSLAERYNNYINSDNHKYMKGMPVGTVIYMHVFGLWMQVLHIIDVAFCYKLVPVLAYELSMYYFIELTSILFRNEMDEMCQKSLIAFVLQNRFDYYNVKDSLEDYMKALDNFKFEKKLELMLKEQLKESNSMSIKVIAECLDCVYKKMNL